MSEKVGIFSALWRFVTFWKLRKALGLVRAADRQFTSSPEGIRDAYDIHADKVKAAYNELLSAVAGVEMYVQERNDSLGQLAQEKAKVEKQREGAVSMVEKAQAAGDQEALTKHRAAFERFQARIEEIEAREAELKKAIAEQQGRMKSFERKLTELQAELQKLPAKKAAAIADFVSLKTLRDLNERVGGLKTSIDRGPIDAVEESLKQMRAEAAVQDRIRGTDVEEQDSEYLEVGQGFTASEKLEQMLAARKAEKDAKTGTASAAPVAKDRPQI